MRFSYRTKHCLRCVSVPTPLALVFVVVGTYGARPTIADTLPIFSYAMQNGESGAGTYYDDGYGGPGSTGNPNVAGSFLSGGLGQLTNGLFGPSDLLDHEWIGWYSIQPTITVDLGSAHTVNSISVHAANFSVYHDVGAPGTANLSYSQDNVNFTPLGTYTMTAADLTGDNARWIDIPFGVTARYARVQIFDGTKIGGTDPGYHPWIFLDEARADGVASAPAFSYPNFSNPIGLQLGGSAAIVGNALRLSNASRFNSGSVFTSNPLRLGNENSFSTHFQFRISNSGGVGDEDGVGADGLVFVVQAGNTGGGIGYANPSLGIEFDTYNNGSTFGDPSGNHVGIDLNGNIVSVKTQTEPTRFNNGEIWNAWVDYNGSTDLVEARWAMNGVRPASAQLSTTVDLEALLHQNIAYAGFTSSTGAGWGDHDLLSWESLGGFAPTTAGLSGDFNSDGVVNAADYITWRKYLGTTYTQADYNTWRTHFGQTAGTGTSLTAPSIPEPSSLALLLPFAKIILVHHRRPRFASLAV